MFFVLFVLLFVLLALVLLALCAPCALCALCAPQFLVFLRFYLFFLLLFLRVDSCLAPVELKMLVGQVTITLFFVDSGKKEGIVVLLGICFGIVLPQTKFGFASGSPETVSGRKNIVSPQTVLF